MKTVTIAIVGSSRLVVSRIGPSANAREFCGLTLLEKVPHGKARGIVRHARRAGLKASVVR